MSHPSFSPFSSFFPFTFTPAASYRPKEKRGKGPNSRRRGRKHPPSSFCLTCLPFRLRSGIHHLKTIKYQNTTSKLEAKTFYTFFVVLVISILFLSPCEDLSSPASFLLFSSEEEESQEETEEGKKQTLALPHFLGGRRTTGGKKVFLCLWTQLRWFPTCADFYLAQMRRIRNTFSLSFPLFGAYTSGTPKVIQVLKWGKTRVNIFLSCHLIAVSFSIDFLFEP